MVQLHFCGDPSKKYLTDAASVAALDQLQWHELSQPSEAILPPPSSVLACTAAVQSMADALINKAAQIPYCRDSNRVKEGT